MVTLALDTSTRMGSCAVVRGDLVMAEVPGDPARSHAERLPADLMMALDHAGCALADVDVFAVAIGPGSFTGLRVGIAAMQGLALAAARPLVGVSALDALARAAAGDGPRRVATWVDAWRGEVFAALYDGGVLVEPATVERPQRLLERLPDGRTRFIGDGAAAHRDAIRAALGPFADLPDTLEPALAGIIGGMAVAEVRAGRRPGPADIQALYVRRPDVELYERPMAVPDDDGCRVEPYAGEEDLEGILAVEAASFTNPWTRAMYEWELQNRSVCHILVVRAPGCRVAGFCSFWLVVDEIHINNVAVLPEYRGRGLGTRLMRRVLTEGLRLGADRATLEVRASNVSARTFYEGLGFRGTAVRKHYYTNPVEDALILWREPSREIGTLTGTGD